MVNINNNIRRFVAVFLSLIIVISLFQLYPPNIKTSAAETYIVDGSSEEWTYNYVINNCRINNAAACGIISVLKRVNGYIYYSDGNGQSGRGSMARVELYGCISTARLW